MRISLGGLVSSTTHHGNHEQLHCSQETDSLRIKNLRDYTQQIALHLSDPDYDLYMEYNDDSHYLCALQGGDTEDHQIFQRNHWMIDSGATKGQNEYSCYLPMISFVFVWRHSSSA